MFDENDVWGVFYDDPTLQWPYWSLVWDSLTCFSTDRQASVRDRRFIPNLAKTVRKWFEPIPSPYTF
ncbi:hypothetical protein RhiXN_02736 [Rhizoctonia solani]|uniref:Uncharacterized protein n=1 Tax=Rhizoctonia solani TaxID=456999 RepID=A0A8H8NS79_9AGAM|nr:uncharacterized protein RhiXN_02736 [Rhizoctonia solani]QRW17812.1 hypothetical protein RhiXN_02736 [Rhizoctonia solani]